MQRVACSTKSSVTHPSTNTKALNHELQELISTLPDPTSDLLMGFTFFTYEHMPCLKFFCKYLVFSRVFACVEILCGYVPKREVQTLVHSYASCWT